MGKVASEWWTIPLGVGAAVLLVWLALMAALWLAKPDDVGLADMARLLPDVLRLLKRLAADRQLPRRIRVVPVVVLALLASPIDLIPDFIPVIGFADDVIITVLTLRWIVRAAGADALSRHWPGTPDGLAALHRLCRLPDPP